MSTYVKLQILGTVGIALYSAGAWVQHQLHLRATVPVTATVEKVARECRFDDPRGGSARGPCVRDDFYATAYKDGKRQIDIDGTADVSIYYSAPRDGSFHTGTLRFGGRDDQFYLLKAGDPLPIRVDTENPSDFSAD